MWRKQAYRGEQGIRKSYLLKMGIKWVPHSLDLENHFLGANNPDLPNSSLETLEGGSSLSQPGGDWGRGPWAAPWPWSGHLPLFVRHLQMDVGAEVLLREIHRDNYELAVAVSEEVPPPPQSDTSIPALFESWIWNLMPAEGSPAEAFAQPFRDGDHLSENLKIIFKHFSSGFTSKTESRISCVYFGDEKALLIWYNKKKLQCW